MEVGAFTNNVFIDQEEALLKLYSDEVSKRPECVSFVTGQPEGYLVYELLARTLFQHQHPDAAKKLGKVCLLRYPDQRLCQTLTELFQRFPMREDYDTVSSVVQKNLIAMSPSLRERDRDESAFAIFKNNDRDNGLEDHITELFKAANVLEQVFQSRIQKLLKEVPMTGKGGILTQVFLPKDADLSKVIYRAEPYGIKVDQDVHEFFQKYPQGDNEEPQLRFLSGAIWGFPRVEMVRYTFLNQAQLDEMTKQVRRVVLEILEENQSILSKLKQQPPSEELALKYLDHHDPMGALRCANEIEAVSEELWEKIIVSLIDCEELEEAEKLIQEHLARPEKALAALGMKYLDRGAIEKVNAIIERLPESHAKNLLLLLRAFQYSEYADPALSPNFSTDFEDLVSLCQPY
ncbi:MAG: hypothetical protein KDK64_00050 [Chlamydiia bacterium]|nr:hypothetical protein [Chlamydiia bacterium]